MNLKSTVLEHEILATLARIGLTISSIGSGEKGHIPLRRRMVETSFLQYGTLVKLLNEPNFKPEDGKTFMNQVTVVKEQIGTELKYDWDDIDAALLVLESNGDIKDEDKGSWIDIEGRKITLTAKGVQSLYSKRYLREKEKELQTSRLEKSTIMTNGSVIIVGFLTLFASIVSLFIAYLQYNKEDAISKNDFDRLIQSIQQIKLTDSTKTQPDQKINISYKDTTKAKKKV